MDTARFMQEVACRPDDVELVFHNLSKKDVYESYKNSTNICGLIESLDIENECFKVKLGDNLYATLPFEQAFIQDGIEMTHIISSGLKVPGHYANSIVNTKINVKVTFFSDEEIILTRRPALTEALRQITRQIQRNKITFYCRALSFSRKSVFVDIGGGILGNIPISALSLVHYTDINRWIRKGDCFFANLFQPQIDNFFTLSRKDFYTQNSFAEELKVHDIITVTVGHRVPKNDGYYVEITPGIAGIIDSFKSIPEGTIKLGVISKIIKTPNSPCGYHFRIKEY